jgi:hypothetical protein
LGGSVSIDVARGGSLPASPFGPSHQAADFTEVFFGIVAARDVYTSIEDTVRLMSFEIA